MYCFVVWVIFLISEATSACPPHCFAGSCDKNGICGSCSGPWWGPTCSNSCPLHCFTGQCDFKTGACGSCSGDWWGPTCSNPCPLHCFTGQCDFKSGNCGSCSGDWWGLTCSNPCPLHCFTGQCYFKTGCCGSCTGGYVGNCTCSISPECASPQGLDCNWYSTCLNANSENCPIIEEIMASKCQEYYNIEASLSDLGVKWSQYVRSCLQQVLAKKVLIPAPSGNVDCQVATESFFGDHLGCYLNGPVSLCQLPYEDIAKIVMHGSSIIFTKYWYDPLTTGLQLKVQCDMEFWETIIQGAKTNSANYLGLPCYDLNVTASLVASMNDRLALKNWTITFENAYNVTNVEGSSFLLVSTLNKVLYPLNVTIATEMVTPVMQYWAMNNTQCLLEFNGNPIGLPNSSKRLFY